MMVTGCFVRFAFAANLGRRGGEVNPVVHPGLLVPRHGLAGG